MTLQWKKPYAINMFQSARFYLNRISYFVTSDIDSSDKVNFFVVGTGLQKVPSPGGQSSVKQFVEIWFQ